MSMNDMTICANCGKGEDNSGHLKKCNGCMMVKYCSRDCQKAHRPQHKKACKLRAAELHEEALFKPHPPKEECPVCFLPMMVCGENCFWKSCCGKNICTGCIHGNTKLHGLHPPCPFCRTPAYFKSSKEATKRMEKRMELGDPEAFHMMGCAYAAGGMNLPVDKAKAVELLNKAIELGSLVAHNSLGCMYYDGDGVVRSVRKAKYHLELAAIGGSEESRYHLGKIEIRGGTYDSAERAVKHWMLGAAAGSDTCLRMIKETYRQKFAKIVTKEQYETAIRAHARCLDEMRSKGRDIAADVFNRIMKGDVRRPEDVDRMYDPVYQDK